MYIETAARLAGVERYVEMQSLQVVCSTIVQRAPAEFAVAWLHKEVVKKLHQNLCI